jgi:hypothetical protein
MVFMATTPGEADSTTLSVIDEEDDASLSCAPLSRTGQISKYFQWLGCSLASPEWGIEARLQTPLLTISKAMRCTRCAVRRECCWPGAIHSTRSSQSGRANSPCMRLAALRYARWASSAVEK